MQALLYADPAAAPKRPVDYRDLLGESAWRSLPDRTRERFLTHEACYEGTMSLTASLCGWLFAWLLTPLGAPLPRVRRARVPAEVVVSPDAKTGGSCWTRRYRLAGKRNCTISSTKALDRSGALVERLNFGLRMHLELFVDNSALHFKSTGYSIEYAGLSLRLPSWWPPGCTEVVHRDLGDGRFRFTMNIEHPWLGALFHHDGVFSTRGTLHE